MAALPAPPVIAALPALAAVVAAPVEDSAVAVAHVVVVEAAAVHVAVVVEAADVDERMNEGRMIMESKTNFSNRSKILSAFSALGLLVALVAVPLTTAQTVPKGTAFPTAQAAADAIVAATESYDEKALTEILGPDGYDIIHSGEPARDKENSQAFAAQAKTKMRLDINKARTRATMIVGDEEWPMPVPIVKVGKSWFFDTKAGRQELLLRRVGRNELDAIQIARGYVEAQHEYALAKKENGVNQYAQHIIATDGKEDGLAWKNADGSWGGPIGEKAAEAIVKGYHKGEPYHGYYFKVLKGQGPAAPLGELDYVIKGVMIGGFALIASPAQYRNTGVKSFMVSQDGVVYEKDLGPKTVELFQSIDRFNPDRSWTPVSDK